MKNYKTETWLTFCLKHFALAKMIKMGKKKL